MDFRGRGVRTGGKRIAAGFLCAATALMLSPDGFARSLGGTPVVLVTADLESRIVAVELKPAVVSRRSGHPGPRSIQAVGNVAVVAHTAHGALTLLDGTRLAVRRAARGLASQVLRPARRTDALPSSPTRGWAGSSSLTSSAAGFVGLLELGGPARHVSIDPSGRLLWTALGTKADRIAIVDVRDPELPRLLGRIRPSFLAHDVGFTPGGDRVWVTSGDRRQTEIVDRGTGRSVARLQAGAPPVRRTTHAS